MVDIILGIVSIILAVVSYYLSTKARVKSEAEKAIDFAEDLTDIGEQKMKAAVATLRNMIPSVARPFFTNKVLEKILQNAFDSMESYAKKQIEKKGK